MNRDLSRRIRTVSGITSHKQVVRNDIRLAAKIIQNLDARLGLWAEEENDKAKNSSVADSTLTFSGTSRNPVLNNITDFLIEEASAEEEELLGASANEEGEEAEAAAGLTRDDELIKVLDRLLFYLRIVHSVDYYNHCEYPNEDEMPNRCGIMHARGIPPSSKVRSPVRKHKFKKNVNFLVETCIYSECRLPKMKLMTIVDLSRIRLHHFWSQSNG